MSDVTESFRSSSVTFLQLNSAEKDSYKINKWLAAKIQEQRPFFRQLRSKFQSSREDIHIRAAKAVN